MGVGPAVAAVGRSRFGMNNDGAQALSDGLLQPSQKGP
jgi:hypothetical protein